MITTFLIALVSGIISGVSFLDPHFSFVIWFSFVPLLYRFLRYRVSPWIFFLAGIAHYSVMLFWVGYVSKLGCSLLVLYLALYWVLFGQGVRLLSTRVLAVVSIPAWWVCLEFVRENILSGFGWGILGYSQFKNIYLIQIADLGSAKIISFLIMTVNVGIAFFWIKKRNRIGYVIYFIVLIGISCFYSMVRLAQVTSRQNVTVSLVQPNIPQEVKWEPSAEKFILDKLLQYGETTNKSNLVIFPESAWPVIVRKEYLSVIEFFAYELDRDILMGVIVQDGEQFFNHALLVSRSEGLKASYRKIKLVPFGEYVPFRRWLEFIDIINRIGDMSAGSAITHFEYDSRKFAVLICFEDLFPGFVSRCARDKDFLINITNDAWFHGNPQAMQHLAIMTLRAVENHIPIVRCANTGISGVVDSVGRNSLFQHDGERVMIAGVWNGLVPIQPQRSVYYHMGELFTAGCALLILYLMIRLSKSSDKEEREI